MTKPRLCALLVGTVIALAVACGSAPSVDGGLDGGAVEDAGAEAAACEPGGTCSGVVEPRACDRSLTCRPYFLGTFCMGDVDCAGEAGACTAPQCLQGRCFDFWLADGTKCGADVQVAVCKGGVCVADLCPQVDGGC